MFKDYNNHRSLDLWGEACFVYDASYMAQNVSIEALRDLCIQRAR